MLSEEMGSISWVEPCIEDTIVEPVINRPSFRAFSLHTHLFEFIQRFATIQRRTPCSSWCKVEYRDDYTVIRLHTSKLFIKYSTSILTVLFCVGLSELI